MLEEKKRELTELLELVYMGTRLGTREEPFVLSAS